LGKAERPPMQLTRPQSSPSLHLTFASRLRRSAVLPCAVGSWCQDKPGTAQAPGCAAPGGLHRRLGAWQKWKGARIDGLLADLAASGQPAARRIAAAGRFGAAFAPTGAAQQARGRSPGPGLQPRHRGQADLRQ
jgi:hypothetical protein